MLTVNGAGNAISRPDWQLNNLQEKKERILFAVLNSEPDCTQRKDQATEQVEPRAVGKIIQRGGSGCNESKKRITKGSQG